jgi:hypothetical protein
MRKWLFMIVAVALWIAPAAAETTDAILDSLQHSAFRYFWHQANPANGLIRDRSQSGSPCSIASQGFGLSAICIAIDHGWITRTAGRDRVLTALNTLWTLPQGPATSGTIGYRGFFYHFLHMSDGLRQWEWNTELSSIDTALLMAGILDCRQYFDGADATETQIRTLATQIYERVEWDWMVNPSNQAIRHGWRPDGGAGTFIGFDYRGYSEAMILYIVALGSPTHPPANPTASWNAWTATYNWGTQFGQTFLIFPPLFGHQYSHCWVDFRNKRDAYMQVKGIDYFENSRRATLAQQAYCIANPFGRVGYGANQWGLTAGDGPTGYTARGAPPAQNDDGTITPTAVIASLPFAPEISRPTIQHLYDTYRNQPVLPGPCESMATYWGPYGFRDGFNLTVNPDWYDCDVIGIDQGPIILMIENYRSGGVWNRFMGSPHVQLGLQRAGFVATVGVGETAPAAGAERPQLWGEPNPFTGRATLRFYLPSPGSVRLTVHDVAGREVARLVDGWREGGEHIAGFDANGHSNGVYWYRLATRGGIVESKGVLIR